MKQREYILNVLMRVYRENGYASLIMRDSPLAKEEMGFVSEVVYGTIRNYELLEYQWRDFAKGHVKRKSALILDMSIYQLFFLDGIPDYAIINEANELAGTHERKFVNAILRKVQKRGLRKPAGDDLKTLSILSNHPEWLLGMWNAHYGRDTVEKLCQADQERGNIFGRINTLKITKEELEKDEGVHFINDISFTYDGSLIHTPYFEEGKVLIQDINSAATVKMLDVEPGMKVLDLCAAPGTKTQEIAMYMQNQGEIIACDLYEQRTGLISELMMKTGVTICKVCQNDATVPNSVWDNTFDRILIDAPCSGLGDLRKKPEIRMHIEPRKIDEIVSMQKLILDTSRDYLKDGGILVYSTCTLNQKENERQIRAFIAMNKEFELLDEKTVFPFENGGDGFYMAKLRKKIRKNAN